MRYSSNSISASLAAAHSISGVGSQSERVDESTPVGSVTTRDSAASGTSFSCDSYQ